MPQITAVIPSKNRPEAIRRAAESAEGRDPSCHPRPRGAHRRRHDRDADLACRPVRGARSRWTTDGRRRPRDRARWADLPSTESGGQTARVHRGRIGLDVLYANMGPQGPLRAPVCSTSASAPVSASAPPRTTISASACSSRDTRSSTRRESSSSTCPRGAQRSGGGNGGTTPSARAPSMGSTRAFPTGTCSRRCGPMSASAPPPSSLRLRARAGSPEPCSLSSGSRRGSPVGWSWGRRGGGAPMSRPAA